MSGMLNLEDKEVERIGLKFLRAMEIEVGFLNPFGSRYYNSDSFQEAAAKEIINKLFDQDQRRKLKNLIKKGLEKKYKQEDYEHSGSYYAATAHSEITQYIIRHRGTATGKIFAKIDDEDELTVPCGSAALKLLGLIVKSKEKYLEYDLIAKHFSKSYELFRKFLIDLRTEHGRHYTLEEVKGFFSEALEELEEFVKALRKKAKGESKTNNPPKIKPSNGNQAGEVNVEGAGNGNQNEGENSENEGRQGDSSENTNENEEENFSEPEEIETDDNGQDQNLEKLRADTIAEISQAMQEAQITDQDLPETDRQGEKTNDPAELRGIIEQIERFRGEKVYNDLKERGDALKKKLAEQDIESYLATLNKMTEQELKDEEIKENELDEETQIKLRKLKNRGIQQAEADEIKDEVSNDIKLKGAKRKLEKLLEDFQSNPSDEKKKEIIAFIKNSNSFYQEAYKAEKSKIDNLFKKSNSPQKKNTSESSFPTSVKYVVGGMVAVAVIFVLAEVIKKRGLRSRRD
nr:2927_t:CDS:2 [Entrophospora candida]